MARRSAGILLYRLAGGAPEVLLVHPGGPFWARKDAGVWSIPKGEYDDSEDALACALREFEEETGTALHTADLIELGEHDAARRQGRDRLGRRGRPRRGRGGEQHLHDGVAAALGRTAEFPEIDRAGWFGVDAAREKLNPAQAEFLDRLMERLAERRR